MTRSFPPEVQAKLDDLKLEIEANRRKAASVLLSFLADAPVSNWYLSEVLDDIESEIEIYQDMIRDIRSKHGNGEDTAA